MINRQKFCAALTHAPYLLGDKVRQERVGYLLDAAEKRTHDERWIAYELATDLWETGHTLSPIEEIGHGRGHAYGVPTGPWHQIYDGRGDVQLTWEANYRHATQRLQALKLIKPTENLEKDPKLALRPDIAALVMVLGMEEGWFTGKKLGDFFNARIADAVGARRIINGTDKAYTIAGYYRAFYAALKAAS
jgi:putative chitinase